MKKLYTLILSTLFVGSISATTINVSITSNQFTPPTFTANIGDVVMWTLNAGVHNVTSASVPAGAASFASGTMSTIGQTFSYTITHAGTYGYFCSIHGSGMAGGFNVTATTIAEPTVDLLTNAYPNPFNDKLTIKYGKGIQSIDVFNVVGEKVKSIDVNNPDFKVEVNFEALPSGIYFYRTYSDGNIIETRKIVKSK